MSTSTSNGGPTSPAAIPSSPLAASLQGSVMLHEVVAPFTDDWRVLLSSHLLPLHRQLRPHLTPSHLSPESYISLLETVCSLQRGHLVLALHSSHPSTSTSLSPASVTSGETQVVGFVLYRDLYDTFNGTRVLVDDWVVDEGYRGQGVGTLLLSYVHQWCADRAIRFLTLEVPTRLTRCQPLLARHGVAAHAFAFTYRDAAERPCPPSLALPPSTSPASTVPTPPTTSPPPSSPPSSPSTAPSATCRRSCRPPPAPTSPPCATSSSTACSCS